MSRRTSLTIKQSETVGRVEQYLGFDLADQAEYVKNSVICLGVAHLNQQQIFAIEGFGRQFGAYRVEPCGHKKICMILEANVATP